MDRIRIRGGNKLSGVINISGAKNAALPLMIIPLLSAETVTLHNVPRLVDVSRLQRILQNHGVDITTAGKRVGQIEHAGETLKISAKHIVDTTAPYDLVSKMRASFWVLGPLIARMGEAKVSLPGGCAIGTRPVDMHLLAMEKLGAECVIDQGYVIAKAKNGLKGGHISFSKVSVGATHGHFREIDFAAAQALLGARDHIAAFDLDLGAELLQRHDQEIDRPRADGAAAGHRHLGLAHARQQRRHHPEARAHLGDQVVGRGGVDDVLGRDVQCAAGIGIVARAFAGDHDVDAVIAEDALQQFDVGQPRRVVEDQRVLGQKARDHQRQRGVLGARNRDRAVEALTADNTNSIHDAPLAAPSAER